MARNAFGEHAWAFEEEKIAALPHGCHSIGIGNGLVLQTGLSQREIYDLIVPVVPDLIDGGANLLELNCSRGRVTAYATRRGKAIDIGNRMDFDDIGMLAVCDLLDAGDGGTR